MLLKELMSVHANRFIVIVVIIGTLAMGVVGRWIYQSSMTVEDYKQGNDPDMIEMRTMSNEGDEFAERPGRVLLPQSC